MTKVRERPEWIDGFLFLGNQLALDFLNTRPIQNGEAQELLPDFTALLRWFRAAELLSPREMAHLQQHWEESACARRTLEEMREFREELRKEVVRWEAGGNVHRAIIEKLNALLAAHPMLTSLKQTENGHRMDLSFETRKPEDFFAPLAYSAAKLFAEVDHTRVRKCGQCALHFLDTSKKGTRRWCSTETTGRRVTGVHPV